MPRKARDKDSFGIYYIQQKGNKDITLFKSNEDKDKFLSILAKSKEKNDFKLYAYCLANPNEYHLLINANGSDISKIMKEINISYAIYLNLNSSVYRDRFKSILIRDKESLITILNKIHENGRKSNNIYNSYCFYSKNDKKNVSLLDKSDFEKLNKDDCEQITLNCKNCIKTIEEANKKIFEISSSKNMTVDELLKDKKIRNDLIKKFRRKSTLSLKEIGQVFGGLSESAVCKILKCK